MNRHHRRATNALARGLKKLRNAALCSNGITVALHIQLLSLEQILVHPDPRIVPWFLQWIREAPEHRWQCLTCDDSEWGDGQPPPAGMVVTRPFDERKNIVMFSAVCSHC